MKKLTFLALAVAAMVSCNKENNEVVNPNTPVEAKFTQGVITRTSGNDWVQNDQIGITMTEATTHTISEGFENIRYKAVSSAGASDFTADGTIIYYPQDGAPVDFYAYYPYQQGMIGGNFNVDVSSGDEADIDLLRAFVTGKNKDNRNVPLTFEHRLSHLTMNITRGQGVHRTEPITAKVVGSMTKAEYNIFTDQLTVTPNTAADIPVDVNGLKATVILVPQTMGANAAVVFTVDSEEYRWSLNNITFEKGKNHTYDITVTKSGIEVNGSIIEGWSTGNGGSGTAQ